MKTVPWVILKELMIPIKEVPKHLGKEVIPLVDLPKE